MNQQQEAAVQAMMNAASKALAAGVDKAAILGFIKRPITFEQEKWDTQAAAINSPDFVVVDERFGKPLTTETEIARKAELQRLGERPK